MDYSDPTARWYSYSHQKATIKPPVGTQVLWPWLNDDKPVIYVVISHDVADHERKVTIKRISDTVSRKDGEADETKDVIFLDLAPTDNYDRAAIRTANSIYEPTTMYRVADGKEFVPMYFKQDINGRDELVLLTPKSESKTEMLVIPHYQLNLHLLNTMFVLEMEGDLVDQVRHMQITIRNIHQQRIDEEVARQQGVAAEWIASMKTTD